MTGPAIPGEHVWWHVESGPRLGSQVFGGIVLGYSATGWNGYGVRLVSPAVVDPRYGVAVLVTWIGVTSGTGWSGTRHIYAPYMSKLRRLGGRVPVPPHRLTWVRPRIS